MLHCSGSEPCLQGVELGHSLLCGHNSCISVHHLTLHSHWGLCPIALSCPATQAPPGGGLVKVGQSCLTFYDPRLHSPWNSPGQNTGVGSLSLLQGIFPTQGSNPGLPYSRWILYQLSHQGSPRILEWVAYPFSSRSSRPRNRTGVSCIPGGFFAS